MKKSAKAPDRPPIVAPEGFQEVWDLWIEYKKVEKKEVYASEKFEQKALNHLIKLSFNDPEIAMEMVNNAIVGKWSGFFALKNFTNGSNINGGRIKSDTEKWADIAAAASRVQYSNQK